MTHKITKIIINSITILILFYIYNIYIFLHTCDNVINVIIINYNKFNNLLMYLYLYLYFYY